MASADVRRGRFCVEMASADVRNGRFYLEMASADVRTRGNVTTDDFDFTWILFSQNLMSRCLK